jgi:thiol:disulfide interchange protein
MTVFPYRHAQTIGMSFFVLTVLLAALPGIAQQTEKLYDPAADATAELDAAIARAGSESKHVLVQVGGNWCSWCLKLDALMKREARIDSLLAADYVFVRVNYSKENHNTEVLERLAWPQRFGFPVLIVLDGSGDRLHTQDSGLLEKDGGHDPEQVERFLRLWAPESVSAESYRE